MSNPRVLSERCKDSIINHFEITNRGGDIAQSVQVVAELHIPGEPDEEGEQEIEFLAGGEQKRGNFVLSHDPRKGELVLRVASYKLP